MKITIKPAEISKLPCGVQPNPDVLLNAIDCYQWVKVHTFFCPVCSKKKIDIKV